MHSINFFFQQILPPRISEQLTSFNILDSALNQLQCLSEIREQIYSIVAAVLHLGNIHFDTNSLENAQIHHGSLESLQYASDCLCVDQTVLESIFLERKIKIGYDTTT